MRCPSERDNDVAHDDEGHAYVENTRDVAGNVLAIMPHPERAAWLRQVPEDSAGPWGERRRGSTGSFTALEGAGPGRFLFESLARHLGVRVPEAATR